MLCFLPIVDDNYIPATILRGNHATACTLKLWSKNGSHKITDIVCKG